MEKSRLSIIVLSFYSLTLGDPWTAVDLYNAQLLTQPSCSVVQRQLWLLNNIPNMTKGAAYDIARREFYQLRLREDIQRRVAAEEAESTGAQWGRRMLDIGMELENQEYENWKEWAKLQAQLMEQKTAAFIGAPEVAQTDQSASQNAEPATERA